MQEIMDVIRNTFSASEEEMDMIRKRILQYSPEELENFKKNYITFGIDEVLDCIFNSKNKKK